MLRGYEVGTYYSVSFPRLTHFFYEQRLVSVTCCIKSNWCEFVRQEAWTTLIFNIASSVLPFKTLTRYNIEINQCPARLYRIHTVSQHAPYACTQRVLSSHDVATKCSPGCVDLFFPPGMTQQLLSRIIHTFWQVQETLITT